MKRVLFDLGDVVARYRPERRLPRLAAVSGLAEGEVDARLWRSGLSSRCDAGELDGAAMHRAVCDALGVELPRQELARLWASAFEPDPEVLAIAARVAERVPVGLLTNNPPLLEEVLDRELPAVAAAFPERLFSWRLGVRKPAPELYAAAERALGLAGEDLLLIDDSGRNVEAALGAGWAGIRFTDADALRASLREAGILDDR